MDELEVLDLVRGEKATSDLSRSSRCLINKEEGSTVMTHIYS